MNGSQFKPIPAAVVSAALGLSLSRWKDKQIVPDPFEQIEITAAHMDGFPAPWFVSGGWAIDLFLGRVTRDHSDIEIGIYRRASPQSAVR